MESSSLRSILLVDDDEEMSELLAADLRKHVEVHSAVNSANALVLARRLQLDAAVVDFRLGHESGIELIHDLRKEHPELRLALLTGFLSAVTALAAAAAGANLVLAKPTPVGELLRQLETGSTLEPDLFTTPTLHQVIWEHVSRVVADCDNNVSEAARRLDIHRNTVERWLQNPPPSAARHARKQQG